MNGAYRTILNLKKFNEYCTTEHFKMESIKNVINMLKPGMFLASIDIKDAFYSVLIFPGHRKYLRFIWKEKIYQFLAMPNGYIDVMGIFNKLLKPLIASLHELGCESSVYTDDSLLLAQKFQECFGNVLATMSLLQALGFVIHPTKSIFVPTQKTTFLGFEIDTLNMTLTLTSNKKENIRDIAAVLLLKQSCSIRTLASFLGNIVSSFEAVPNGKLYYRNIEQQKIEALKTSKGNFDINIKQKNFKLYGPFLWMGFNCLKARATSRRQFTFYHQLLSLK